MKSRISIDVNDMDNDPIVKIEANPSDDLRDKMVWRFLEGFGKEGHEAYFKIVENTERASVTAIIVPVSDYSSLLREDLKIAEGILLGYRKSIGEECSFSMLVNANSMAISSGFNNSAYFSREVFRLSTSDEKYNIIKRATDELINTIGPHEIGK